MLVVLRTPAPLKTGHTCCDHLPLLPPHKRAMEYWLLRRCPSRERPRRRVRAGLIKWEIASDAERGARTFRGNTVMVVAKARERCVIIAGQAAAILVEVNSTTFHCPFLFRYTRL